MNILQSTAIFLSFTSIAFAGDPRVDREFSARSKSAITHLPGIPLYVPAREGTRDEDLDFCVSPDSRLVAATRSGIIRIWELKTGKPFRVIDTKTDRVEQILFAPDSKSLMAVSEDQSLLLDVASGRRIRSFDLTGRQWSFAPDGSYLVGQVKKDGESYVSLVDPLTGKVRTSKPIDLELIETRITADSKTVIGVGKEWGVSQRKLWLVEWNFSAGKGIKTHQLEGEFETEYVAIAPDAATVTLMAAKKDARSVAVFDTKTAKRLPFRDILGQDISWDHVFYGGDGNTLFVATEIDDEVWFNSVNLTTGKFKFVGILNTRSRERIVPTPDGKHFVIQLEDGEDFYFALDVLGIPGLESIYPNTHKAPIFSLAYSGDGRTLLSNSFVEERFAIDSVSGRVLYSCVDDSDLAAPIPGPGGTLITAGVEGGIEIEDPRTGKVHSVFPLDKFLDGDRVDHLDVDKLHLSPDRKTVLAYVKPLFEHPPLVVELRIDNGASTVRKQTTHTFQGFSELKGKKETKYCAPCAFVRSGSLAIVDDDRGFSCWDYRTDSKWFLNEGDPASLEARVLVTPETQSIVYYGEQIRIVERFSGKDRLRIPLTSISDKVWQDVAIQGRLLAMTRPGGEIEFYDRFTGQRLGNLKAYPVTITSLAFHPAGQILAAGYADGAVIQWDLKDIIPNPKAERRSSEALEELWERLRHPDARTAYRATAELLDTKDVVGFLAGKVSPASEKEFIRLLKHLDSDQFATREKAFDELQRKFLLMRSHLERVELESLSPQQREFVSSLKPSVIDDRDALRTLRVLEILEFLGGEDAKRVLKKVASGDPHHLLTLEAKNAIQRLNGK